MSDPILTYDQENKEVRLNLIKFIEDNGIKQSFIAKKTNLSNCSISLFINSKRMLTPEKLEIIRTLIY